MTYIPATDAAVYKTSAITRMVAEGGRKEEGEQGLNSVEEILARVLCIKDGLRFHFDSELG